jgi:hypothetical protein
MSNKIYGYKDATTALPVLTNPTTIKGWFESDYGGTFGTLEFAIGRIATAFDPVTNDPISWVSSDEGVFVQCKKSDGTTYGMACKYNSISNEYYRMNSPVGRELGAGAGVSCAGCTNCGITVGNDGTQSGCNCVDYSGGCSGGIAT